jgi:chorismate mutase/prephenate dehydratase
MKPTVGAFGKANSYSFTAAQWAFGRDVQPVPGAREIFDRLRDGRLDIGVLPLENVSGGWISDVLYELMRLAQTDPHVRIIREIDLPVVLCVAAKSKTMRIDEAKRIYSHPYPLIHTSEWIRQNNPMAEKVECPSTSEAAERVAKDPQGIALCNITAARRTRLHVLLRSIPTPVENITRFVAVSKRVAPRGRPERTCLWFRVQDRPGSLLSALAAFKKHKVNLTRIESRALDSFQRYGFFTELEGGATAPRVARALKALRAATDGVTILGSYPVDLIPRAAAARLA